eukprot:3903445-Pleurochrysis_carterae.AAC.1
MTPLSFKLSRDVLKRSAQQNKVSLLQLLKHIKKDAQQEEAVQKMIALSGVHILHSLAPKLNYVIYLQEDDAKLHVAPRYAKSFSARKRSIDRLYSVEESR